LSFWVKVLPGGEQTIYYWICAGENYAEASRLNKMIMGHGAEYFIRRTSNYWRAWVNKDDFNPADLPEKVIELYKKSLMILRTNIDAAAPSLRPMIPTSSICQGHVQLHVPRTAPLRRMRLIWLVIWALPENSSAFAPLSSRRERIRRLFPP